MTRPDATVSEYSLVVVIPSTAASSAARASCSVMPSMAGVVVQRASAK